MPEDKKNKAASQEKNSNNAAATVAKDIYGDGNKEKRGGRGRSFKGRGPREEKPKDEMEQRMLEVARVTRVMAGGKRMNFRACVAIGDKKGNVAVGLGKGADVTMAVNKAVNRAKKEIINVPIVKGTIPHEVEQKVGAAKLILKPAKQGRGVIAGGVTRAILELAGVPNITSKTLGSNNKINNARCTIEALKKLHRSEKIEGKDSSKKPENKEVKTEKKELKK